jgi:hypothetical protein
VSVDDAMERLNSLDSRPSFATSSVTPEGQLPSAEQLLSGRPVPVSRRRPACEEEDDVSAPRPARSIHPDLERALVCGVWLLSGLVCTFMAFGAFVEFERANIFRSFMCAISAAAGPTSVMVLAIDGWLKHHRANMKTV